MEKERELRGIVLSSKPSGESAKRVTILSCEEGLVTFIARGVKKPGAKLRFATEMFAFGDFNIVNGRYSQTLTDCNLIDGFYEVRADIEKFYLACGIAEVVKMTSLSGVNSTNDVLFYCNLFNQIKEYDGDIALMGVKASFEFLKQTGYGFYNFNCVGCGKEIVAEKVVFSPSNDGFVCEECGAEGSLIDKNTFECMRQICQSSYEELCKLKLSREGVLGCMRFFVRLITYKLDIKPNSLIEFGKIISFKP